MCSELLAGALARLGQEVYSLCPEVTDREDEEQLNRHFHVVLARGKEGQFKRLRELGPSDHVFQYFMGQAGGNSLLVALKNKMATSTQGVVTAGVCVCVEESLHVLLTLCSCTGPVVTSCLLSQTSTTCASQQQLQAVEVTAPAKSWAFQQRRVSVDVELTQRGRMRTTQKVLPATAVYRQVAPGATMSAAEKRLSSLPAGEQARETSPQRRPEPSSKMTRLKQKLKKKLLRSSSKEKDMEDLPSPATSRSPVLAWQHSDPSVERRGLVLTSSTKHAAEEREKGRRRRHSQEQMWSRQKTKSVRHLRRVHTFSAESKPGLPSNWTASRDTDV